MDLLGLVLGLGHIRSTGLAVNLAIRKRLSECGDASFGDIRVHETKVTQLGQSMEVLEAFVGNLRDTKIEFPHVTQPTDVR